MNLSERIRSLISEPMTAAEIHSKMPDVSLPLIRGLIQTMLARGLAHKIGDKRPYQYKVGRGLEIHNRGRDLNVTQQVRECIKKNGPISPDRIAMETGIAIREVRARITEMKKRKFIQADENGCLVFLRDRITPTTRMADSERRQQDRVRMKLARQRDAVKRKDAMTVVKVKEVKATFSGAPQSVDDWLKSGGVIDRSPTPSPFERLTIEDIAQASFRPSSQTQVRTTRNYLAG